MKDFKTATNNYNNDKSVINYYNNTLNETIQQHFTRNSIVDMVTKYELYYHVCLGNYAFETFLDVNDTVKKLSELKLEISAMQALFKIYEVIDEHFYEENFDQKLDYYIRKKASQHALEDFLEKDEEMVGKHYYRQQKLEDIDADISFNEMMWQNFEVNYQKTFEHFNTVLTEQLIQDVQKQIISE